MAKWTLANIKSAALSYVAAAKQANTSWTPSAETFTGLLEKIMKTVIMDGNFVDKLPELDADNIEFGQAIEEFYINLSAPITYSTFANDTIGGTDEGKAAAAELRPYRPAFDDVVYSERLGRYVFPTTVDDENYKKAFSSADAYANLVAITIKRLYDALAVWKYGQKKQLLGNMIKKALGVTGLVKQVAKPVDTSTGEAFIRAIKNACEDASFVSEGNSLNSSATIGAQEGLILYIKKGIMSSIEVDTLAGAFHAENLAVPCKIKVVEDFGTLAATDTDYANFNKVYALLVDPRGIKLHSNINKVKSVENAVGDYRNYFAHTENTGFISKYTFVRGYKEA